MVEYLPIFCTYFAFCLGFPFQRWLEWAGVLTDLNRVLEVFRLEKFVNCSPLETFQQITVKRPNALMKSTHESTILFKPFPVKPFGQPVWHLAEDGNWGKTLRHKMFLFWKLGIYKWVWVSHYRCLLKKNGNTIILYVIKAKTGTWKRGTNKPRKKWLENRQSACCPDLRVDAHCLPFCWIGVLFHLNAAARLIVQLPHLAHISTSMLDMRC